VIGFVKDKGITIDGGRHADVFDNNIFFTGNDGIQVENINSIRGYAVEVSGNTISNTGGDGIEVSDSSSAWIEDNVIKGSGYYTRKGADGIHVNNVGGNGRLHVRTKGPAPYSVVIRKNDIDKSGDDGIQVLSSGDTLVERNTIDNSGSRFNKGQSADGINIETALHNQQEQSLGRGGPRMQSVRIDVIKNTVSNSGDDGIQIVGATDVLVKRNTVSNSGDDGINVLGFAQSSFPPTMGNVKMVMKRPPVSEFKARIVNNTVTDSGTEIKKPTPRSKFKSEYDFSKMSGGDGIQVEGFDRAVVKGGSVSNSVENGLYVSGPNNGKVIVSGVTFNDNDTGAHFESGRIDLTKEGNTFNGGRVGMKFSPVIVGYDYGYDYDSMEGLEFAETRITRPIFQPIFSQLSLKDTDGRGQGFGGTIGSQTFNGQSDFYIELDNGALFNPGTPTVLDASQSTFDGVRPASKGNVLTDAQFAAINGKIFDYRDRNDLGLFFFGANENTDSVNQEEVFNSFDPYGFGGGDVQVTILGLPSTSAGGGTPTGAAALNNIAPAAGDEEEELTPEELNALSAAAGGNSQQAKSWGEAASSARSGGATTFSFGSTLGASAL
jgi:parallel beta-helix repeat protein